MLPVEKTPMPVFQLTNKVVFPHPDLADESGILAVGGDLRPERLLLAYGNGIFPWPAEGYPLLWHSPDPRWVIEGMGGLHISRSLTKELRRGRLTCSMDRAFEEVISACASIPRGHEDGTWITDDITAAFSTMHELGFAHSVEVWRDEELVGGLYGMSLGTCFFGESMFSRAPSASRVALVRLAQQMERWEMGLIDVQVHTDHLETMGAVAWPRGWYLKALAESSMAPTRRGQWTLDEDLTGRQRPPG